MEVRIMEWNMEKNSSAEWKKIASMEYGKIVFHSILCLEKTEHEIE